MKLAPLSPADAAQAARLLAQAFPHAYGQTAPQQIAGCLAPERVNVAAYDEHDALIGFVGAIPQYGQTGWELHPLAVDAAWRGRGIGTALVRALEDELRGRGCCTVYLGSDDEFGQTTLSGVNLFDDLPGHIARVRNLRGHPYEFYQKLGYQIIGVLPDANGLGKPDIWLARSLVR